MSQKHSFEVNECLQEARTKWKPRRNPKTCTFGKEHRGIADDTF